MRDDYPTLTGSQCTVVMADGATGHVLVESGKVSMSNTDVIYKVFDNILQAEEYVKMKQDKNDTWEFGIYDHTKKIIQNFRAKRWK